MGRRTGPRLHGRLLGLIAAATAVTCLLMILTVGRTAIRLAIDLGGDNLRRSLSLGAEQLADSPLEATRIDEVLDSLWAIPAERRWVVGDDRGSVTISSESAPHEALLKSGHELLTATGNHSEVQFGGTLGFRSILGAVRLDGAQILVVEYRRLGFWRHLDEVVRILAATLFCAFTVGLLLSRRLAAPILGRLETLRAVLDAYGAGDQEARLPEISQRDAFANVYEAFNRMGDRIDELEAEKRQRIEDERALVAGLAHDVNTPMTVIRGYAEILLEEDAPRDAAARRRIASELLGQSLYVQAILDDLLAMTKATGQDLSLAPEPTALDPLFDAVVDTFQPIARRHGIELIGDADGLEAQADPLRLRQILTNLVRNALVHARGATLIELTARREHPEGGSPHVVVSVCDDGSGIADADVLRLFERYHRIHEADGKGWGLGLAIVKMLAELHGGSCTYVPRQQGACFEVALPPPDAGTGQ
ncbi:MAG: HAMP domain-containing sensor histidine kinase [Acidobacteriota bacterium]